MTKTSVKMLWMLINELDPFLSLDLDSKRIDVDGNSCRQIRTYVLRYEQRTCYNHWSLEWPKEPYDLQTIKG